MFTLTTMSLRMKDAQQPFTCSKCNDTQVFGMAIVAMEPGDKHQFGVNTSIVQTFCNGCWGANGGQLVNACRETLQAIDDAEQASAPDADAAIAPFAFIGTELFTEVRAVAEKEGLGVSAYVNRILKASLSSNV